MSNVYTQLLATPKKSRNGRTYQGIFYGGSGASITQIVTPTPTPTPTPSTAIASRVVIPFDVEQFPSITDYDTLYASTYGQYPILSIFTSDNGNFLQRSENATLVLTAGVITSITYDLAEPATGFIILS